MKAIILGLLVSSGAFAKSVILCSTGRDAEKYLNGMMNDKLIVYTSRDYDKETEKFKEVTHSVSPKAVSAPAMEGEKMCVTVTE